jgi:hypothetical protein
MSLGAAAPTTSPQLTLLILPLTAAGPQNCAWLKTLNASIGNSNDIEVID